MSAFRSNMKSSGSPTSAVYNGQVGEQIAGQTLLALNTRKKANLHYWYREQKGATSEVDYLDGHQ